MTMQATTTYPQPAATRPATVPSTAAEWAARIVHRHPHLAQPVAKALKLAEAGHVTGNDIHCMVINAERNARYSLDYHNATGAWSCTCYSYQNRPYRAGHTAHCKHTLARAIAERAGLIKDN
jgi:23S rRNA G2445 N2-methylase RlmL